LLKHRREQLRSALCDNPGGPLDVCMWVPGGLTPGNLARIKATRIEPNGAADYTDLLRAYSSQNVNATDLRATPYVHKMIYPPPPPPPPQGCAWAAHVVL